MNEIETIKAEMKARPRPVEFDQVVNVTQVKVALWLLVAIEAARFIIDYHSFVTGV